MLQTYNCSSIFNSLALPFKEGFYLFSPFEKGSTHPSSLNQYLHPAFDRLLEDLDLKIYFSFWQ